MSYLKEFKKITTHSLLLMKQQAERISMLTCYDYSMALLLDAAGVDCLLVGDSARTSWQDTKRPCRLHWTK